MNVYFPFSIVIYLKLANCWDLQLNKFNISSNYYISNIAIFGNRAFLSLPRSVCHNSRKQPTIIEIFWNSWRNFEDHQPVIVNPKKSFFSNYQDWDNCTHIQDAISLDLELLRSRLWILDRGNPRCSGKIIVYNLLHRTPINYNLDGLKFSDKLNTIIVDIVGHNTRAYIGFIGNINKLLIFSLNDNKWWIVDVKTPTDFLTISSNSNLIMTGYKNRGIYSVDLQELPTEMAEFEASYLGEKLGDSSGLVAEFRTGLIYYLTNDYAVVRWDMRHPSQAEFYTVLSQSFEDLPYVAQLYTGAHGIWALVNPQSPYDCLKNSSKISLNRRLLKIVKFNVFM